MRPFHSAHQYANNNATPWHLITPPRQKSKQMAQPMAQSPVRQAKQVQLQQTPPTMHKHQQQQQRQQDNDASTATSINMPSTS
jgi:hypothetical protein